MRQKVMLEAEKTTMAGEWTGLVAVSNLVALGVAGPLGCFVLLKGCLA